MKIVIFIGHHKVGSTSLQWFLAVNARYLRQRGILYPGIDNEGSIYHPRFLAQQAWARVKGLPIERRMTWNARQPHNALAFKMRSEFYDDRIKVPFHKNVPPVDEIFQRIHRQIDSSHAHTVILCSEAFSFYSAVSVTLIERLRREFEGAEVKILCTLRRVDQHLISWWGQLIRIGDKIDHIADGWLDGILPGIHFDYALMLGGWLEVFGKECLSVRSYSDVLEAGGAVEDFIGRSEIDFGNGYHVTQSVNPSLPHSYFEVCRLANHRLTKKQASNLFDRILQWKETGELGEIQPVELLGTECRQMLYDRFLPIHGFLGGLVDEPPLFRDQDQLLETTGKPWDEAFTESVATLQTLLKAGKLDSGYRDFLQEITAI